MNDDEKAAIRAREKAATKGPWERFDGTGMNQQCILGRANTPDEGYYGTEDVFTLDDDNYSNGLTEADLEFIAHAREDIPALLAALESVEAEQVTAEAKITEALAILSWLPDHDGDDLNRVQGDYMYRAQLADEAFAALSRVGGDTAEPFVDPFPWVGWFTDEDESGYVGRSSRQRHGFSFEPRDREQYERDTAEKEA